MVEHKPVTKKPGWVTGVILPTLVGVPVGYGLQEYASSIVWYIVAVWQVIFAIALIVERAPIYGATSIPQSKRLCELYGISWIGMAVMTLLSMKHIVGNNGVVENGGGELASQILMINLICTYSFSIAAGPTRLVNANDNEMNLVPTNALIVAWAGTSLYLSTKTTASQ